MLKKVFCLSIIIMVMIPFVSFAQSTKIVAAAGGSFPIEGFSLKSDVGFGTFVGIEQTIGTNITFVGAWSHTENDEASGDGTAKGDIFDARFRYYFNKLNLSWLPVNPYVVFGAGVARIDWTGDEFDPVFIMGTATGIGALWQAKEDLHIFLEGEFLTGGEEISRFVLKGGVAIPVTFF